MKKVWLIILLLASTSGATDWYVNGATGVDGAPNNGLSELSPWATIVYAAAQASSGDTIYIADGVYAETSGSGWWAPVQNLTYAALDTVTPSVVITGNGAASLAQNVYLTGNVANITFRQLTFSAQNTNDTKTIYIYATTSQTITGITFDRCTINAPSAAVGAPYGVQILSNKSTSTISDFNFSRCVFDCDDADGACMLAACANVDAVLDDFVFEDCSITSAGGGVRLEEVTNAVIRRCYVSVAALKALNIGVDGSAGDGAGGTIEDSFVFSASSHAVLVGAGVTSATVRRNYIVAGDYSLVVKQCSGVTIQANHLLSAGTAALYFKAANGCFAYNNTISAYAGVGIKVGEDGAATCGTLTIKNNLLRCVGAAEPFDYATNGAASDAGGSVVDYNCYVIEGTGDIGMIYGTNNVATIAAARNAWNTYDVVTNDDNSGLGTVGDVSPDLIPTRHGQADYGKGDASVGLAAGDIDAYQRIVPRAGFIGGICRLGPDVPSVISSPMRMVNEN